MELIEALKKRRTVRKFKRRDVDPEKLKKLVDWARLAPSGMNRQPLSFLLVDEEALERKIFANSGWGGNVEWNPTEEERPPAYIVILIESDMDDWVARYDVGLAAENICLGALEYGLATCLLGSIDEDRLREIFSIPEDKKVGLTVAVGYPDQEAFTEPLEGDSTGYWLDEDLNFHVPKRDLEEILYINGF